MKCVHNRVSFSVSEIRQVFSGGAITHCLRKSICIALTLSLLASSTPAAPQTIVGLAKETSVSLAFWFRASEWRKSAAELIQGQDSNGKKQQKQLARNARVARIEISPGEVTIDLNEIAG